MATTTKGTGYTQCPGVPELNYTCTRKVRTRVRCKACEKIAAAGEVIIIRRRRCPGVPQVGHSCNVNTSKKRCRTCQTIYDRYQAHLDAIKKEKINRWCLKCGKKYIANNRFLRLCNHCRSENESAVNSGYNEFMFGTPMSGGRRG